MTMRVLHRYLGFFLVGIMAVYAISGIVLIFRDTDFLKKEIAYEKQVKPNATAEELGKLIKIKRGISVEDSAFIRYCCFPDVMEIDAPSFILLGSIEINDNMCY